MKNKIIKYLGMRVSYYQCYKSRITKLSGLFLFNKTRVFHPRLIVIHKMADAPHCTTIETNK